MELDQEISIDSKEKRILKSEAARKRRQKRKNIAFDVLQRQYARNRKARKNK